jgi:predicted ATP-grasp superfamily ATP-dependent carboligase
LNRVRDPAVLADTLRARGFAVPDVRHTSPRVAALKGPSYEDAASRWLLKPAASGGGHGIRIWDGEAVPLRCYLQEFIDGIPGSVVFAAAGGRAVPLGIFRQLIGDAVFGASGFQYCGNILGAGDEPYDAAFSEAVCDLARAVADGFGLVGVNGIDFVVRDGVPYPTEVNPRWCASMELVERAYGVSVFGAHAGACAAGELPDFDLVRAQRGTSHALGKAVVFAQHDVAAGDLNRQQGDTCEDGGPAIRDVPRAGSRIPAGRPICTVFAAAPDSASCHAALARRARRVHADLAV